MAAGIVCKVCNRGHAVAFLTLGRSQVDEGLYQDY